MYLFGFLLFCDGAQGHVMSGLYWAGPLSLCSVMFESLGSKGCVVLRQSEWHVAKIENAE